MGKNKGKFRGTELEPFEWDEVKIKTAALIAEGRLYFLDIAEEVGTTAWQISMWRRNKEFMDRINELTLEHELATKAGLMREAYYGLQLKREVIAPDKTTHLDYLKELADLQGFKKQQVELSGGVKIDAKVTITEAVEEYSEVLEELSKSE